MNTRITKHIALPFDVLCNIFAYYDETPKSPLETLLLVCRLWNGAALKTRDRWSDVEIHIKDAATALFWSRYLPRRFAKSCPQSPIYFKLTVKYPIDRCGKCMHGDCKWDRIVTGQLVPILEAILGPNGSFCARWRELSIDLSRFPYFFPRNVPFFSYATPNLRSVTLEGVDVFVWDDITAFLPCAPQLQVVRIFGCSLPAITSAENLKMLEIRDAGDETTDTSQISSLSQLLHAENVESLRLECKIPSNTFYLPPRLPFLRHLSLAGVQLPRNIRDIEAPNLKRLELSLTFDGLEDIGGDDSSNGDIQDPTKQIIYCKNIAFGQISTLFVRFDIYLDLIRSSLPTVYGDLLQKCSHVQHVAGDRVSTPLLLKLLRSDCERNIGETEESRRDPLTDHNITVSNGRWSRELRSGRDNRLMDIDSLASELGWNLNLTGDAFLDEWKRIAK